jgi:hypothetical protein
VNESNLALCQVDAYRSDVWRVSPAGTPLRRIGYVIRDAFGWAVCVPYRRQVGPRQVKIRIATYSRWYHRQRAEAELLALARLAVAS